MVVLFSTISLANATSNDYICTQIHPKKQEVRTITVHKNDVAGEYLDYANKRFYNFKTKDGEEFFREPFRDGILLSLKDDDTFLSTYWVQDGIVLKTESTCTTQTVHESKE